MQDGARARSPPRFLGQPRRRWAYEGWPSTSRRCGGTARRRRILNSSSRSVPRGDARAKVSDHVAVGMLLQRAVL